MIEKHVLTRKYFSYLKLTIIPPKIDYQTADFTHCQILPKLGCKHFKHNQRVTDGLINSVDPDKTAASLSKSLGKVSVKNVTRLRS